MFHGFTVDNGNSRTFPLSVPSVKNLFAMTLLSVSSLVGCTEESPARATRPADAAGGVAPPAPEKSCKELCERATRCGTDLLEKSIKAVPGEVALLARTRDEEPRTIAACSERCVSDAAEVPSARECLTQTSCELFAECMEKLTPAPR
jgi:hypothetical protein